MLYLTCEKIQEWKSGLQDVKDAEGTGGRGGVLCVPGPTSPYPHRQGMEGWGGKLASIGSSKVTQVTLAGRAKNCCRQSTAGPMAGGQRGPEETARSPQPAHAPGPCGGPQCQARAEPVLTVSQELVLSHSEVLSLWKLWGGEGRNA